MNELAIIFDRMGIRTADVLEAAGTKWNFLKFRPGLVGGHCIGVDPYYLTTKAQQLGYQPEVILAGRRINNNVGPYVAQRLREDADRAGRPGEGRARRRPRPDVQGERATTCATARSPTSSPSCASTGSTPMIHDPPRQPARGAARVRRDAHAARGVQEPRRADRRGQPQGVRPDSGRRSCSAMVRDGGCFVDVKSVFSPGQRRARHPVLEPLRRRRDAAVAPAQLQVQPVVPHRHGADRDQIGRSQSSDGGKVSSPSAPMRTLPRWGSPAFVASLSGAAALPARLRPSCVDVRARAESRRPALPSPSPAVHSRPPRSPRRPARSSARPCSVAGASSRARQAGAPRAARRPGRWATARRSRPARARRPG